MFAFKPLAAVALALLLLAGGASVAFPADAPLPPTANFLARRTVLWLGRTQVIPVRLDAPAAGEHLLCVTVDNPSVVEVLRSPVVLPGETLGFARARGLRPGRARLRTLDGGTLEVEVRRDPSAGVAGAAEAARPRIIGPVAGATVWGRVAVAVETLDAPPPDSLVPVAPVSVQLRLPNGRKLEPTESTGPELGPVRRFTFEVNADELPAGPAALVALADRGRDAATSPLESEPVRIHVLRPAEAAAASLAAGPFADNDSTEALAPLRPARFGTRPPKSGPLEGAESPRALLCHSGDPAWCQPLVVPATGRYQMMIRARGDAAVGALPTVALHLNDTEAPTALARLLSGRWHRLPLGPPVRLEAGPQVLTVRFANDFNVNQEDRNLFLDRFELVRVPDSAGAPPALAETLPVRAPLPFLPTADPRPQLLYPANGQSLFEADAVVARVSASVAWADVVVDGQPLGLRLEHPPADRPLVFPLPLRGFTGSNRHLAVRAADGKGRVSDSPFHLVHFLDAPPPAPGPYERALRLLDRLAYGSEPAELAAVLTLGETAWLDSRLSAPAVAPADEANLARALVRYPKLEDNNQTALRALAQSLGDENPVRARFTLWAENHFSTWLAKTGAALKWHEHAAFARAGIAPFGSLLDLSARSPAMLVYLDQEKSYAGRLNENYAREVMELHTLGVHGGYSQADVTALAGLLNGWTLTEEARLPAPGEDAMLPGGNRQAGLEKDFRFDPFLNDGKPRRVLGLEFAPAPAPGTRFDRVRLALEMLAAHPATAEHVCRKLAGHYLGSPVPDALVRDLARVFGETGGDLKAVLRALAAHPVFWETPPRLANPQDYGLRFARVLRGFLDLRLVADQDVTPKPEQLDDFFKKSGMGLFDRVTPDGYPEHDAAYADSNALLQRWRFAQNQAEALARLVPQAWRQPSATSENAPTLPTSDPAQRLLDLAALRLTGRLLGPGSNAAARELLGDDPKPEEFKQAVLFVSLLPEANLR